VASIFIIEEYAEEETNMKAGGRRSNRLAEIAVYVGNRRQMEASRLSCSCLLLVHSVVSDSQWVLADHYVLRARQRGKNCVFIFLFASYNIRNLGKPTAP
jgi:hypothetical protein